MYFANFASCPLSVVHVGIDRSFATNYLSHVLLTEKLLPLLAQAKKGARVLQMSSSYHWQVRYLKSRHSIGSFPPAANSLMFYSPFFIGYVLGIWHGFGRAIEWRAASS